MPKLTVDEAVVVEIGPCIDDTDFKTLETAIAYNAAGMSVDLIKNSGTAITKVDITPTTSGSNDWTHKGNGVYELELTAAQNDTIGTLRIVGVCTGVLPFESPVYEVDAVNTRVWYAEKTGNDSNDGHRFWDAKLTIQAAIDAASAGDIIKIGPGTYDENVTVDKELVLETEHEGLSKIISSSGTALNASSKCTLKNLWIATLGTMYGVFLSANNVKIEDCFIKGSADGLAVSNVENLIVRNTYIKGKYDGMNLTCNNFLFENCIFETDGTYGTAQPAHCMTVPVGWGVFNNCIFCARRTATTTKDVGAVTLGGSAILLSGCAFYVYASSGCTGAVYGIKSSHADTRILVQGGAFHSVGANASIGPYDLYSVAGSIVVAGANYSTSNGSIKHMNAGLPLGDAVRMLVNKAVQNKSTGVIEYYDDAGVAVVLTHTPSDDNGTITRTPS